MNKKPALVDADADFGLRGGACFAPVDLDGAPLLAFDACFPFDGTEFFACVSPLLLLGADSAAIDDDEDDDADADATAEDAAGGV